MSFLVVRALTVGIITAVIRLAVFDAILSPARATLAATVLGFFLLGFFVMPSLQRNNGPAAKPPNRLRMGIGFALVAAVGSLVMHYL